MATVGKVVIGGQLNGVQNWSIGVGLNFGLTTTPTPAAMSTFAQNVYALFLSTVWNAAATPWAPQVGTGGNVRGCTSYWKQNPGDAAWAVTGASTGAPIVSSGTRSLAPQDALVVSLLTDFAGRKGRGRCYLPLGVATWTGVGTLVSPAPQQTATNFAAWLTAVNGTTMGGSSVTCALQGALSLSFGPGGAAPPYTHVRVDNVVDTQRRRRDKITATSTGVATI